MQRVIEMKKVILLLRFVVLIVTSLFSQQNAVSKENQTKSIT